MLISLYAGGLAVPFQSQFSGLSGGSLMGVAACANVTSREAVLNLIQNVVESGPAFWADRKQLIRGLIPYAAPDAYRRCSGKVHVTMSRVRVGSGSLNESTPLTISKFKSQTDYFDSVFGSSSIVCAGSTPAAPDVNTSGPCVMCFFC